MDGIRSALIVASDQYTDRRLRRLRAPASDARSLAAVLQDPQIGGFEVRTLLNEPAHLVNLAVEEFFADRRPGDLLLVHFSGHGVKDEDGELYFAASNTVLGRLGATAVAAEFVSRRMTRSRSRRVVLLLDCCYAGAFERGLVARAGVEMGIEQQFGGRGRAVITASSAMEYAFEGGELADTGEVAPSVFTSALVEGLESGEADRDQDGLVGLDELYDYVYDKVRVVTPNQTPGKWTFGVEGELYIARRARPVTVPASLPAELQHAIDSPLAGGGDLHARATSSATWLKLRQAGDQLVIAADTSAPGQYEDTVIVDSDGGTATIRVSMMVGHAPLSAFKAAAPTNPQPVLETPQGAASDPQRDLSMAASAAADWDWGADASAEAANAGAARPGPGEVDRTGVIARGVQVIASAIQWLWSILNQTFRSLRPEPRVVASENDTVVRARRSHRARPERASRTWLRRPIVTTSLVVLLVVVIGGGYVAWRWSQDQYYIGADSKGQEVLIYRGVNQHIAGISLSRPYRQTGIKLAHVPPSYQQTVRATDPASSLKNAQAIVTTIRNAVTTCQQGYAALQQWVVRDNAYQAAVALAKKQHKPVNSIQGPGPQPPKPSMCQPSTAFGIAPDALVPSAGAS